MCLVSLKIWSDPINDSLKQLPKIIKAMPDTGKVGAPRHGSRRPCLWGGSGDGAFAERWREVLEHVSRNPDDVHQVQSAVSREYKRVNTATVTQLSVHAMVTLKCCRVCGF